MARATRKFLSTLHAVCQSIKALTGLETKFLVDAQEQDCYVTIVRKCMVHLY